MKRTSEIGSKLGEAINHDSGQNDRVKLCRNFEKEYISEKPPLTVLKGIYYRTDLLSIQVDQIMLHWGEEAINVWSI